MANLYQNIRDERDAQVYGGGDISKIHKDYINYSNEYEFPLADGYIKAIDEMIKYFNSIELDRMVYNKVLNVMTNLVLNDEDVDYIDNTSDYKESGAAIPNMTEICYINDIPFQFDIIEAVYLFLLKIARENAFFAQNGIFGDINISGIVISNIKDLNESYQSYVIGLDGEIQDIPSSRLVQKISDLCRANNVLRERMIKLMNGGKKVTKKEEIEFRRAYKFDGKSGSFQKRLDPVTGKNAPISVKVFELMANKNKNAYVFLKKAYNEALENKKAKK